MGATSADMLNKFKITKDFPEILIYRYNINVPNVLKSNPCHHTANGTLQKTYVC
jgi:hypothetical protein